MGISEATWQELNDPWNEWETVEELNFDAAFEAQREDAIQERDEWWREQDAAMVREELERIEAQAEAEELRHSGYWD